MPVAVVQLCYSIVVAADRTKQDSRILVIANGMEIIVHERHDSERARRETRDDRLSLLRERFLDRINDDLIVVTVLLIAPAASTVPVCQLQVLYTVALA